MSTTWRVAIAEASHGKIFVAEEQILEAGGQVYVPRQYRREKSGKGGMVYQMVPRIAPYFFVAVANDEEYQLIKSLRGVYDVLLYGRPVPASHLHDFRAMEAGESHNVPWKAGKRARDDLQIAKQYRVLKHPTFGGQLATLMYALRGTAYLYVANGAKIDVPDSDIELVAKAA